MCGKIGKMPIFQLGVLPTCDKADQGHGVLPAESHVTSTKTGDVLQEGVRTGVGGQTAHYWLP